MKARVYVTLKPSVFDPQGKTIHDALLSLGYARVTDVRQGKFFEVALEGVAPEAARQTVEEIARKVLANPVIESYRVELEDAGARASDAPRRAAGKQGG
jgi:phosphoribosylformylglycinamidine synthase